MKKYKVTILDIQKEIIYNEDELKVAVDLLVILDYLHTIEEIKPIELTISMQMLAIINQVLALDTKHNLEKVKIIKELLRYENVEYGTLKIANEIVKENVTIITV